MMSETQIHTIARQMLEQLGPGAIAQAAQKSMICDNHGQADEAKEWRQFATCAPPAMRAAQRAMVVPQSVVGRRCPRPILVSDPIFTHESRT
jgi:hypothetical protein